MSLLSLIADVCTDPGVGIAQPTTVINNANPNIVAVLNLANKEGAELASRHDWQNLIQQHTFTSVAAEAQPDALPGDAETEPYDRFVYGAEIWNRTANQKYAGPVSGRDWQILKQGVSGGVTGWWRIFGNQLNIFPAPTAGQTLALEYVTKNWCESADGVGRKKWAADDDVGRVPERLMTLGIIWRWRRAQGFDYAEELATYEREVERASSRDRGIGVIKPGTSQDFPPGPGWDQHIDA
jgi:hypothetical protein